MLSNKVKCNIWLTLAILSIGCIIDRTIRVIDGSVEWWNLVAAIVITAFCTKFYLCYILSLLSQASEARQFIRPRQGLLVIHIGFLNVILHTA